MGNSPDPDLVKVTEIFLIPSSFLVAALGTADSNPHRAAVSVLGLIISALWWVCSNEALSALTPLEPESPRRNHPIRTRILSKLPYVFIVGWMVSVIAHVMLWNRPLGH